MQDQIKPVKIEVSNVRKLSVDEFAEKVNEEKTNNQNDNSDDSDSETKDKKDGGIFGKMKTIEEALAEKEQKRKEKQKKMDDMMEKKMRMKPFILFTGVKDNPIPYENKYMKAQFKKLKEVNESIKLPVIKEKLKKP
jgi:hypothetical protein